MSTLFNYKFCKTLLPISTSLHKLISFSSISSVHYLLRNLTMGVISITQEFSSSVAPARMFKALVLDSHNLIPKLVPHSIKSIEFVEGDGCVGSIKQTNFPEGSHFKFLKHKIDALDTANHYCKYTLIEGDVLGNAVESIGYEVKFETSGSGCVCKTTSHYHAKEGIELKEEDIKAGKDKAMGMYKLVEDYLVANPDVYA